MNKKYLQSNPGIFVRFDPKTTQAIRDIAKDKRWSMASTVAWCVEQQLDTCNKLTRRTK